MCIQPVCDTPIGPPAKKRKLWQIRLERNRQIYRIDSDLMASCLRCGCFESFQDITDDCCYTEHGRRCVFDVPWGRSPRQQQKQKEKQQQKQINSRSNSTSKSNSRSKSSRSSVSNIATNGEAGQKAAGAELPQEDEGAMESKTCIQPVCDTTLVSTARRQKVCQIRLERNRQIYRIESYLMASCLRCGCFEPF